MRILEGTWVARLSYGNPCSAGLFSKGKPKGKPSFSGGSLTKTYVMHAFLACQPSLFFPAQCASFRSCDSLSHKPSRPSQPRISLQGNPRGLMFVACSRHAQLASMFSLGFGRLLTLLSECPATCSGVLFPFFFTLCGMMSWANLKRVSL